jgi:ADP-ribose pyrophosphatase YjhB (NUDIX family)
MDLPIIKAGGGLVWNEIEELLMIYRRNKWDLPKGKLDNGETIEQCALREVKEETGLKEVTLGKFNGITQHQYFDKYLEKEVIKESHWFSMKALSNEKLDPQLEEDITEIRWVCKKDIPSLLEDSFPAIQAILKPYLEN